MTSDELERAIDFLLKSQASAEARSERTEEQLRQLTERVNSFADTQAHIMQVMTQTFDAQARFNESLRAALTGLAANQTQTEASVRETNESLRETNESLRETNESLRASEEARRESENSMRAAIGGLADRQSRTEEAMARLAEAQASSERRLEALINIVEEGRGGGQ